MTKAIVVLLQSLMACSSSRLGLELQLKYQTHTITMAIAATDRAILMFVSDPLVLAIILQITQTTKTITPVNSSSRKAIFNFHIVNLAAIVHVAESCRPPSSQRLPKLRGYSGRLRLLFLARRLATEWVGHLHPLNPSVHSQEQFGQRRSPSRVRRPAKPARGHCIKPIHIAAVLDSTYSFAG